MAKKNQLMLEQQPLMTQIQFLFHVIMLLSVVLAVGVKVAVQVMPPFTEATAVSAPLAIVRSVLVKPVTASLKVIVTSDVSPAFSALMKRVTGTTSRQKMSRGLKCRLCSSLDG